MTSESLPNAWGERNDPYLDMAEHLAAVARREFEPAAYTQPHARGATEPFEKYLRAAGFELGYVSLLVERASRASGDWSTRPGSLRELALNFRLAVGRAEEALAKGWVAEAAQSASAVAICWQQLRDRQAEVDALGEDVQRAATRKGEAAAEEELRALAAAGERPYRDVWSEDVQRRLAITQRGAKRVWEQVSKDFPHLSSTRGVPKRGRAKA